MHPEVAFRLIRAIILVALALLIYREYEAIDRFFTSLEGSPWEIPSLKIATDDSR